MNWNPPNERMVAPEVRASRPRCTAWTILLLSLFLCGRAPVAHAQQQPTPPVKQGASAQAIYSQPRITQAVDETQLTPLRGNTHPLARTEFDGGAAPPSLPMERMLLVLQRSAEQEAALRELLDEQQDKSSPNYHNWLTPEQFGQRFGPADQDIQTVTAWLESHGFRVAGVAKGRTVIEFSGTAAQVEEAFRTPIHKYVVNGEEHWANADDPQIPTGLAPAVHGVLSLHNFRKQPMIHRMGAFSRSQATGEVKPLLTGGSGANQFFAVGPTDFAKIYNVLGLWNATPTPIDGTGQSIAVVARSNINLQDVRDFRNLFGLPPNDPVIVLDGPDPGLIPGDEGEAILDVQWTGAVAKNAKIFLVISESTVSTSTDGVDLSALYIVDNNLAPVLSESFGACEASLGTAGNRFYSLLWGQAAAQGITVLLSSGDNGSAGCDGAAGQTAATHGLAVSGLASTPFNVAVGGTDFDDAGNQSQFWNTTNDPTTRASAKSYIPETTWNDSCAQNGLAGCTSVSPGSKDLLAGSGGPSTCATSTAARVCLAGYAKPSWQTGTGVPADGKRDLPDVSLFAAVQSASGSFYVVCQADAVSPTGPPSCNPSSGPFSFLGVGGTSASVQAFAGIMALVNQKTGTRQGNANFVLYKLAAQVGASCDSSAAGTVTNSTCIFYDVTKVGSNISVACAGGTPNCSSASSGSFGVLVDPAHTSSPAWTTTGGYDLATGLGSVNATNLANNWSSVSFARSTTTLTLNPVNSTHGQSVSVSITVAPQSGSRTPTGNVSLIGGPSSALGIDAFTLGSSGTVSGTTNLLPGGSYQVTAHYAGDGTFGASDSTPVGVTMNKESSQTFVSLVTFDFAGNVTNTNATTAPYGSPYVLRVDVTNAAGQRCSTNAVPCPTGQVTLTDNNSPLNDFNGTNVSTLNSIGFLEDQPIQLPAGSHSLAAAYAGDNSFNPSSTSSPDTVSITPAATASTVSANPSTAQPGASVTLTALVSTRSSGVAPSGTVQFLNGSTPIGGTVTLTGTAGSSTAFAALRATLTTSFTATASVTANYSGDSNYSASISSAITVTVSSAADFSLSSQPTSNTVTAGGSATYAISANPVNGFNSPVTLTCLVQSPAPTAFPPTCGLSPASITPGGNPSTLTVGTTARSLIPPVKFVRWRLPLPMLIGLALLFAAWICFARIRHHRSLAGATLAALVLFLLLGIAGCGGVSSGGGGGVNGTPAGQYTVTVTGTSGGLGHNTVITLTVN